MNPQFAVLTAAVLVSSQLLHSQETAGSLEEQVVQLAQSIDQSASDQVQAALLEEALAEEIKVVKACQQQRAEDYSQAIRDLNQEDVSNEEKLQRRQLIREEFLNGVPGCVEMSPLGFSDSEEQTIEQEAIAFMREVDELLQNSAAIEEGVAADLLSKKICEKLAAERYAATIRIINGCPTWHADTKQQYRQCARTDLLGAIESCHGGKAEFCPLILLECVGK